MNGDMFNLIVGWALLMFLIGYLIYPFLRYFSDRFRDSYQKWHWRRELKKCQEDRWYFYQKYWKNIDDPININEYFKDKV